MFRAMNITPSDIEDETTWAVVSNVAFSEHFNCHVGADHYVRTLAAQTPDTPEIFLVAVDGEGAGTRCANLLATSITKAFGRDWDIHGPAILIACQSGTFVNLTDEIWSWIMNVESGMVAAPVEPLKDLSPTTPVLADIHVERMRQIAKWGEQRRNDGSDPGTYRAIAARSRENFQNAEAAGGATWHQAVNGPFFESISRTDPTALRAALVELAAVTCAWIEDIDSRTAARR